MSIDKNKNIVPLGYNHDGESLPPPFAPSNMSGFEPIKDCKLCNSKHKQEAEELYDRTENIKRVHKLLTEDRCMDISYGAVRSHLKFHYEAKSTNAMVKEYVSEVESWLDLQHDQISALRRAMAMLEREMMIIASHNEGSPLPERRKNADTMVKLGGLLLNYRSKIEELQRGNDPITLVFNQLKVILQDEMKSINSVEGQRLVKNVLSKLKDSVGHIELAETE